MNHISQTVLFCIVFIHFYSSSHSTSLSEVLPRPQQFTLCLSLHAEALQVTASEGLDQGCYVTARAGFEPGTLRSKGIDSINVPPCPMYRSAGCMSSLQISILLCCRAPVWICLEPLFTPIVAHSNDSTALICDCWESHFLPACIPTGDRCSAISNLLTCWVAEQLGHLPLIRSMLEPLKDANKTCFAI